MIVVFILSALWWIRIRCLWNLPDGRDWLRGKLGLVLMGRAMLSKPLIQFSVDGWSCVISLLLDLKPNNGGGNEGNGGLLQEVPCMHCCPQCLWPWSKPLQRVLKVWSSSHGKVRGPPEMSRWAKGCRTSGLYWGWTDYPVSCPFCLHQFSGVFEFCGVGLRRHTMLWWETQSKSRVLCFNFLISLRVWSVDFSNSWTSVVFQRVVWNKRGSVSSDWFREEVVETTQLSDSSLVFSLTSLLYLKYQMFVFTVWKFWHLFKVVYLLPLEFENLDPNFSSISS